MAISAERHVMNLHLATVHASNVRKIVFLEKGDFPILVREYLDINHEIADLLSRTRLGDKSYKKSIDLIDTRLEIMDSNFNIVLEVSQKDDSKNVPLINENVKNDLLINVPSVAHDGQFKPKLSMGGFRLGAGRKAIGTSYKVSVTLTEDDWEYIDNLIAEGHVKSRSEYFRSLHTVSRGQ